MAQAAADDKKFSTRALPFGMEDLGPFLSSAAIDTHYNKHHLGYVRKLNAAAEKDNKLGEMTVNQIIVSKDLPQNIINLAAQIYNHDFYWYSLAKESGKPGAALAGQFDKDFKSFDEFKTAFTTTAAKHFGSGWVWLSYDKANDKLVISEGHDAGNPFQQSESLVPLLTIDIWEHAYYIDFKNDRGSYIKNFWDFIDWARVTARFDDARPK